MVKVVYNGDRTATDGVCYLRWETGDEHDLSDEDAERLLTNPMFTVKKEPKKSWAPKTITIESESSGDING